MDHLRRITPGAGCDEDGCLRQAVRRPQHVLPKIEVSKPICETFQSCRLDTFVAVDDSVPPAEVEPGEVAVRGLAGGQLKGEIGRRGESMRILSQRSYPSGRLFQEAGRAHQLGGITAQDGCADAQYQTHVVVEG